MLRLADSKQSGQGSNVDFAWSVAIFSSREHPETLWSTIGAAVVASSGRRAAIDVVVNGNRELADGIGRGFNALRSNAGNNTLLRVWFASLADKAHAWNQYLQVWPGSELAYFVDGYAQVLPTAFALIARGMDLTPHALAATGIPTHGRSAKKLRRQLVTEGGLHGNLFALREWVMKDLRDRKFHLPLGLYRNDSTIGAVINFQLDPARHRWDSKRVLIEPDATWIYQPASWWRIKDLIGQWKRRVRQAQGKLENIAIREHMSVQKRPPEYLPATTEELISGWIREHPGEARRLYLANPLCIIAARKACRPKDWSKATAPLQQIADTRLSGPIGAWPDLNLPQAARP